MSSLVVAVSGINAGDNPGPGTGVARSLLDDSDLDVEVIGLAYDALEPGLYMDWLIQKSYTIPYPSKGGEGFLERLRYIQGECGMNCIIPSLDAELPIYIRYRDELADEGIRVIVPTMEQFKLRSKDRLPDIAARMNVKVPATRVAYSEQQFAAALEELGMPVMVKGVFYEAFKAQTVTDAYVYFRKLAAQWGYPIVVQKVISGQEMNVVGVGDGTGSTLGLVAIKKILLTSLGKAWSAVTVGHETLLAATQRFVEEYKWNGPFEMECMISGNDVYLIEINPRFPAWVYFATGAGINLPSRMLRHATMGLDEVAPRFQVGKFFMRYTSEIVTDMDRFRHVLTQGETL